VLLKLLIGQDYFGFELDREIGMWLATIAALGLVGGGFLKMNEDKGSVAGRPGRSV
jgi:hypothetical protein